MFFSPRGKSNGTMIGKFFENSINPLIGGSIRQKKRSLNWKYSLSLAKLHSNKSNKFDLVSPFHRISAKSLLIFLQRSSLKIRRRNSSHCALKNSS